MPKDDILPKVYLDMERSPALGGGGVRRVGEARRGERRGVYKQDPLPPPSYSEVIGNTKITITIQDVPLKKVLTKCR